MGWKKTWFYGEFLYTLCAVEVYSGGTELFVLKNRAQKWTFEAISEMKKILPFPLLGDEGIRRIVNGGMNGGSVTVFDYTQYLFLEKDEFIEIELKSTIQRYSEFFSFENKIKTKIEKVIEKVPLKLEEKIKEIIHIYMLNFLSLSKKFLRIIYDEYMSLTKTLNSEWIANSSSKASVKRASAPP